MLQIYRNWTKTLVTSLATLSTLPGSVLGEFQTPLPEVIVLYEGAVNQTVILPPVTWDDVADVQISTGEWLQSSLYLSWNELGGEWPLYFDGTQIDSDYVGLTSDVTFTIENSEGSLSEQSITFEIQEPLPPSFVSVPDDIELVAGYAKQFKYPEIQQTHPPYTINVDIDANQDIKDLLNLRFSEKWWLGFHGTDETWSNYEGQELTITATLTDGIGLTTTYEHKLTVLRYIPPAFAYPPQPIELWMGETSSIYIPPLEQGSFEVIDLSYDIVPCCLQDYTSSVAQISQNHEVSGNPVVLYIDLVEFSITFYDETTLIEAGEAPKSFQIRWLLTDSSETTTIVEASLDTKVFTPPTFAATLPPEFEVIVGQNLYYEYPLVVEGDKPGFKALPSVSDALESDEFILLLNERSDPDTNELLSYDLEVISTCALHQLEGDQFVNIRLVDNSNIAFIDYKTPFRFHEVVKPTFSAEVQQQLQIIAGVQMNVVYPSIIDGSYPGTSFESYLDSRLDGLLQFVSDSGTSQLVYEGNYDISQLVGETDLFFNVTLTDQENCESNDYVTQLTVMLPRAPEFSIEPNSKFELLAGAAKSFQFPSVIDGDLSPASATIEMSSQLTPFIEVIQTGQSNSLNITLVYQGDLEIKTLSESGDLFVTVRLIDGESRVFTDYQIQVIVTLGSPPSFNEDPKESIALIVGQTFTYTYPLVVEGDHQPANANVTMSQSLEEHISVKQTFSPDSYIMSILLEYDGNVDIDPLFGQIDLFIKVTLYDGLNDTFIDYNQIVEVTHGIPVEFLDFENFPETLELLTNEKLSLNWLTNGLATDRPGFADFTMSDVLQPYLSLYQKAIDNNIFEVLLMYDGDAGLVSLTNFANLWVNIRLWNNKETISVDYKIEITVKTHDPSKFSPSLPDVVTLYQGVVKTWNLPSIATSWYNEVDLQLEMSLELGSFLDWDPSTQTFSFTESETSAILIGRQDLHIIITLTNDGGWVSTFTQQIIVMATEAPKFAKEKLSDMDLIPGLPVDYLYPGITEGTHPFDKTVFVSQPVLDPYLNFDASRMSLRYNGDPKISSLEDQSPFKLTIILSNKVGMSTVYSQLVNIVQNSPAEADVSQFYIPIEEDQAEDISSNLDESSGQINPSAGLNATDSHVIDEKAIAEDELTSISTSELESEASDLVDSEVTDLIEDGTSSADESETMDIILEVDSDKLAASLGIENLIIPPVSLKQQALLETAVDDIPTEKLFVSVPLVARLTTGIQNVKQLILKQRQLITQMAVYSQTSDGKRPPETRVTSFDNSGGLKMGFSSAITFPEGTKEMIQSTNEDNRRRLARGTPPEKNLVEVFAVKGVEGEPLEAGSAIMNGWELVSLDQNGISIKLDFGNPLLVSTSDEPDLLLIQLDLSEFKDENGNNLPESVIKYSPIPSQMASTSEAEQVQTQGEAANSSSKAALGSNTAVNILLAGSMNQVWSVINGLQIVAYMPLFKVKSPGNVNSFTDFFAEIAKIDIIDTKKLTELADQIYLPELDSFSLNFQNAGYDTSLVMPNLGTLLLILGSQLNLVIAFALIWILARLSKHVKILKDKLQYYLFWNGTIRIFMEGYLDFTLMSLLNLRDIFWDDSLISVTICNYFAIVMMSLCVIIPVVLFLYLDCNISRWSDDEFKKSYGTLLEGTNSEYKGNSLIVGLVPGFFFLRRLALCLTLIFWQEFFWGQVAVQLAVCTLMVILIQWFKPLESRFANNIETFNEVISTFVLYLLMCFSDFLDDPMMRNELGKVFIGIVLVYVAVHFYFLFVDLFVKVRLNLLRLFNRCCRKKARATKSTSATSSKQTKQQAQAVVIEVPWVEREKQEDQEATSVQQAESSIDRSTTVNSSRSMLRPQAKSILTNKPKSKLVTVNKLTLEQKKKQAFNWSVSEALDSIPEITEDRYEEEKQQSTQQTSFYSRDDSFASIDDAGSGDSFEDRATRIELSRIAVASSTFKPKGARANRTNSN